MLSDKEQAILSILEIDPFMSQQDMAERLGCSRSLIANLLGALQEKGYIVGKPYLLRKHAVVTCIGGVNLDYKLRLKGQRIEGTSNPVHSSVSFGGVMRNVAENLAHLGREVSLMSRIGQDSAGDELYAYCARFMHMYATERVREHTTGKYIAILDKEGNLQIGYADMAIADGMDAAWVAAHLGHIRQGEWVVADCNMQRSGLEELMRLARTEQKKLVLIGISGPKMQNLPPDLSGTHLLICNRDESEAFFKTTSDDTATLAQKWLDSGSRAVIITEGAKSVVFADAAGVQCLQPERVPAQEVVDVTGAGDSFSAAVIDALMGGLELSQAVMRGNQLAALTIRSALSVLPPHLFPRREHE